MDSSSMLELDVDYFIDEFSHCFTGECRVKMLPWLYRISRIVSGRTDLSCSLKLILQSMEQHMNMRRGMVTLYDRDTHSVFASESFGLTTEERKKGIYANDEGVMGKVVESGQAIVIPRLKEDIEFMDRHVHGGMDVGKMAFFCIPIMHARKVLGTISADRTYLNRDLLKQDFEMLSMIATLISPIVELYLIERHDVARLEDENRRLRFALKKRFRPSNIIGNSKPMLELYELIHKVAHARATVLILGESGVGKELVASAVHYSGPCADAPFVAFNCAALPESLAESELFGHEKGSFTGAVAMHRGCFEQANGGTIFLDEVGELSLSVQAKLLRVLQNRNFERVGGSRAVSINVRVIAATNRDLSEMVREGTFREDLYYRLNVFPITVPPLRERSSDVITLADHFVEKFSRENDKPIKRISSPALDMLQSYQWPGNVRELENIIERAVILTDDEVVHGYNMPPSIQTAKESNTDYKLSLEEKLQVVEREMIVEALKNSSGHVGKAAEDLGLTRRMLGVRMERHGVTYKTYRKTEMEGG